jgi:hypothetical protein
MPCGERLYSIARLIVLTSPDIVSAIAFLIAGPSTGKIAVANSRGSRRTDSLIALSTVGASAIESCRSRAARWTIACGSFSASSSGVSSAVSRRRRSSSI